MLDFILYMSGPVIVIVFLAGMCVGQRAAYKHAGLLSDKKSK